MNFTPFKITDDDDIDKYLMPYEEELGIGITPTLGQLRQKVVVEKMRPQIRSSLKQNSKVEKIVKTMVEMWDAEPDGRITSGCARDRITALMKASEESRTCPKVSGPEQTLP
jgi:hypothetical protein